MGQQSDSSRPLFVRIPNATAERLDAAVAERGASKRQLVTELIGAGLGIGLGGARSTVTYGHASVLSSSAEILTLDEAADLLRVEATDLRTLAESGQLPARRIGAEWRLSRSAVLAWLGADDEAIAHSPGGRLRRGAALGFSVEGAAAGTNADVTGQEDQP